MDNVDKYLAISEQIAFKISDYLYSMLDKNGYLGESIHNPDDLKSSHEIDAITAQIVLNELKDTCCNIYVESFDGQFKHDAEFSIYIDPVDGSLNWDRGIGDPCVVIAFSDKPKMETLNDLSFSFVYGLRSGNTYYTKDSLSIFKRSLDSPEHVIKSKPDIPIDSAIAYLRPGYGFSDYFLSHTIPLYSRVRDIRAVDNTAIEICEIARNAADLLVEARNGSDGFNLLAYPILKNAGGVLVDLKGNDISNLTIDPSASYDYIAANSSALAKETAHIIQEFRSSKMYENDVFSFRLK